MRLPLLLAVFVSAVVAVPVAAQRGISPVGHAGIAETRRDTSRPGSVDPRQADVDGQVAALRHQIRDARDDGHLSRGDARRAGREARLIGAMRLRYGADGLSESEYRELQGRLAGMRSLLSAPTPGRR
jgi:hypothetical protein